MNEKLIALTLSLNQEILNFSQQQQDRIIQEEINNPLWNEAYIDNLFNIDMGVKPVFILGFSILFIFLFGIHLLEFLMKKYKTLAKHENKIMTTCEIIFALTSITLSAFIIIKMADSIINPIKVRKITDEYTELRLNTLRKTNEITQSEYDILSNCHTRLTIDIDCVYKNTSK